VKVAIIHYWFITKRGGEKVIESLLKLYPDADIYTLFYDVDIYGDSLKNNKIYTSSYNRKFLRKHYQKLFPFYPRAVKSLKLKKDYDLIISSESGPAKGILIENKAKHVCYIHSPMRYCWGFTEEYLNSMKPYLRPIAKYLFNNLRKWDLTTVNNVDLYIANSKNVAKRVEKYYQKKAEVIYPPIDNQLFEKPLIINNTKDVYLSFGAITPYKRIDLLIDVFNNNGKKLIVIGDGSEKQKLQIKAKSNIKFKGFLSQKEIEKYIIMSKALLFPGEEDFGMIPLEVMAFGIPVIAFKKGGALETVVENKKNIAKSSGIFFDKQNIESIQNSIKYFESIQFKFDSIWIRNHAKNFEETNFLHSFSKKINKLMSDK
jgi:glycosyltransferase involved in cell wall biosynthesis